MASKLTIGLLLLPLVPLSAIGVVEIVGKVSRPDPVMTSCKPIVERVSIPEPHFAKPPAPAPDHQPSPPPVA